MVKLNPSEIEYDAKERRAENGKGKVVAVFLTTKDDDSEYSDNLGRHNVLGLPQVLGFEISENEFEVSGETLANVKAVMDAAGFTYKKNSDW